MRRVSKTPSGVEYIKLTGYSWFNSLKRHWSVYYAPLGCYLLFEVEVEELKIYLYTSGQLDNITNNNRIRCKQINYPTAAWLDRALALEIDVFIAELDQKHMALLMAIKRTIHLVSHSM